MTEEQQELVVRHAKRAIALHRSRSEAMFEDPMYRSLFVLADAVDPDWEAPITRSRPADRRRGIDREPV